MNCQEIAEKLSEYWGGELGEIEAKDIETHIRSCKLCQQEWCDFQQAITALRSIPLIPPPPDLRHKIQQAIAKHKVQHRRFTLLRWAVGFATGGVVALILSVSILRENEQILKSARLKEPVIPSTRPAGESKLSEKLEMAHQSAKPEPIGELPPSKHAQKQFKPSHIASAPSQAVGESKQMVSPFAESKTVQQKMEFPFPTPPLPTSPQIAELPSEPRSKEAYSFYTSRQMGTGREREFVPPSVGSPPSKITSQTQAHTMAGYADVSQIQQIRTNVASLPIQWQWEHFEPLVVDKTSVWELSLLSRNRQTLTVFVKCEEDVKITNKVLEGLKEQSSKDIVAIWSGEVSVDKPVKIPLLMQVKKPGVRRLCLLTKMSDGAEVSCSEVSWSLIFVVSEKLETPDLSKKLEVKAKSWVLSDLHKHLAREVQSVFLLPSVMETLPVTINIENQTISEAMKMVEEQLGWQWHSQDNLFTLKLYTKFEAINEKE